MDNNKILYEIRELNNTDQDFLFEMLYQSIYVSPDSLAPDREIINVPEIKKYVSNWGKTGDFGYVAIDKLTKKRIGAIWIRYFKESNKGYGYISDNIPELGISVDYDKRGNGIGTTLLNKLLNYINKTIQSVSLSVDPENPAVNLYKRFGFKECGEAGTSIVMRYDS